MMGIAIGMGFFSHLLLDEMCSVDLKGARLNKAFGTAMKFWAPSATSTLLIYGILSYLSYQAIQEWPDDALRDAIEIHVPEWPEKWPKPAWLESIWGKARSSLAPSEEKRSATQTRDDFPPRNMPSLKVPLPRPSAKPRE